MCTENFLCVESKMISCHLAFTPTYRISKIYLPHVVLQLDLLNTTGCPKIQCTWTVLSWFWGCVCILVPSQNCSVTEPIITGSFSLISSVRSPAPISCNKPASQVKHFLFLLPGRHLSLVYLCLHLGLKPKSSTLHVYLFFFCLFLVIFLDFENDFIFLILCFVFYFPLEYVYTLSVIFLFLSFCI